MAKTIVMILGIIFVVIGLLGFVNDPVLGLFEVDALLSIVHILAGVIALWMASMGEASAMLYGKIFGIIYALIAILGFMGGDMALGLIEVNMADNWLHVLLAIVLLYVGFCGAKGKEPMMPPAQTPAM